MSIDRTAEFRQIAAARRTDAQTLLAGRSGQVGADRPGQAELRPRSEFAAGASRIGADIHATAEKLGKLTQLAQSNALLLFADPTEEINELTLIIKQDITSLNSKLAELQKAQQQQRSSTRQHASHSTSMVDMLKSRLMEAARDFQSVLQTRSESIQQMHDRRLKFSAHSCGPSPAAGGASSGVGCGGPGCGSAAAADTLGATSIFECGSPLGETSSGHSGNTPVVIDIPQGGEQMQLLASQDQSYLQSRAHAVESVQSTIVELGSIFEQLAVMVAEQGTMLQRVDECATVPCKRQQPLQRAWRARRHPGGCVSGACGSWAPWCGRLWPVWCWQPTRLVEVPTR